MALTRTQLRDALLSALGQETPGSATSVEQAEVLRAINAGLQRLWLAASHRFLRQSLSVTLVSGQATYTITATAQEAFGPVRLADGRTLRRFDNRAGLDDYAVEILGSTSRTVADGEPWGYTIEHGRNTGAGDDPHAMTLRITPAPNAAAVTALSPATVDHVVECPSYAYADLASGALPVPEGYAETYLLPLCRFEITRSHLFSRTELVPRFEADAQAALVALGVAEVAAAQTGDVGAETPTARALRGSAPTSGERASR